MAIESAEVLMQEMPLSRVYIYYEDQNGTKLQLIEAIRIFSSGEIEKRNIAHTTEVQCLPGECPKDGAQRVLQEILGLPVTKEDERVLSYSQAAQEEAAEYEVMLTDEEFGSGVIQLPDERLVPGFRYIQEDAVTYFTWKKIQCAQAKKNQPWWRGLFG